MTRFFFVWDGKCHYFFSKRKRPGRLGRFWMLMRGLGAMKCLGIFRRRGWFGLAGGGVGAGFAHLEAHVAADGNIFAELVDHLA